MNKKIIAITLSSLVVVTAMSIVMFAQPRISKEKKEFYDKKYTEYNNENDAIGKEALKIAQMPDGDKKQVKVKELKDREIKYKKDSTKAAEEMKNDGYINDADIIDNNAKLLKDLEVLCKMTEWDIRGYKDQELIDFDTKQLNKIKTLLEKVKQSDDSNFSSLFGEYQQMIKSFKEERPIFQEQYRKKHGK